MWDQQSISSLPHNSSFSGYWTQIDNLTKEQESYDYVGSSQGHEITREHWTNAKNRPHCFNRSCKKQFSAVLERPHHCRRCGEVFCADCVRFRRRLNRFARPDPDGEMWKVCQVCFDQGKLTDGQTRNHTRDFERMREASRSAALSLSTTTENLDSLSCSWRNKLSFSRECQRLLKGFEESVGNSEIRRTLQEMRGLVSTPEWMKSSVWIKENLATSCQLCRHMFGLMKSKTFCRICGIAVCKNKLCSTKELLLYLPDQEREEERDTTARMAIIKIVGCPELEPEISLHLRVCETCRQRVISKQVEQDDTDAQLEAPTSDFIHNLELLNKRFEQTEKRVREQLPKYREVVDSLEDNTKSSSSHSNMKILAKAQGDLSDALAQHVTVVQMLKRLKPGTDRQTSLLKAYIRAKCEFYLDNMSSFRSVKYKLSQHVTPETLDMVQPIMDKRAIISTHTYVRQLVYETISLCDKHQLEDTMTRFLMALEEKIEAEVRTCLEGEKEDVNEHMEILKEIIKTRLKENKLIKPSRTQLRRKGARHVSQLMMVRVEHILNQVNFQLQLASANRSFVSTKQALESGLEKLTNWKQQDDGEATQFVFVDKDSL